MYEYIYSENLHDKKLYKDVSLGTEGSSKTTNTGSAMTTAIGASASARKSSKLALKKKIFYGFFPNCICFCT